MSTYIGYVSEAGDPNLECPIEFESNWDSENIEYVAEDFAKFYHSNCDGWESDWPVTFIIKDITGKILGKVKVELEYSPTFSGTVMEA